jgi:predicted nucleotidyltransferase
MSTEPKTVAPSSSAALSDATIEALAARLRAEPDVLVAYLFGSQARGTATGLSDVDIAVLLARGWTFDRDLDLIDAVAAVVGSERADVVVLNNAPVALAYRVISDGRLLVVNDQGARVRHWVETVDRYLDMAPLRRTLDEGLRHRLEEGRFGRG